MSECKEDIDSCYEKDKIEVFGSNKHGPYVRLNDLVYALIELSNEEGRKEILERLVGSASFCQTLADFLTGHSCDEAHNSKEGRVGDKIRKIVLDNMEGVTLEFFRNILQENTALRGKFEEARKHLDLLIKEWPEPYKRYLPKEPYVYYNTPFLFHDDLQKLIEDFQTRKKEKLGVNFTDAL